MTAVLLAAISVFVVHAFGLPSLNPPPWPDEALFADAASHLASSGGLSSHLYREALPSLTRHYYLTPPLYAVVSGAFIASFGPGLTGLRLLSAAIGALTLLVLYRIARLAGLGRPSSLGAVSLTAVDLVFLRASHNARMDILALLLVLLTVAIGLAPVPEHRSAPSRRRSLLAGVVAGLAFLAHPLGGVAIPLALVLLAGAAAGAHAPPNSAGIGRRAAVATMAVLGVALALIPWGLYIAADPRGFVEQFGSQLTRKASRGASGFCLPMLAAQWPLPWAWSLLVLLFGLGGLIAAARARPAARGLWISQLLIVAAVISGCELWYAVYLAPLSYVGLARVGSGVTSRGNLRALAGVAAWVLGAVGALGSTAGLLFLLGTDRSLEVNGGYLAWCRRVERSIPAGSTVMLDCVPTPYFGWSERDRGSLRFFHPAGFRLDAARQRAEVDALDFVVMGAGGGNEALADSVRARGTWVADVSAGSGRGFLARIYRMSHRHALAAPPHAR